ncbi:MerR family transcriptional regulator [Salidesulfovibrio brasiliensis]|uniref:MerR family transcriptional regulator n=1 Tax=Salidesulfovibrio brasiliensis TaxID=221711 RepID=UPI0006D227D0|nr:MerR family transcriptional regulator [Salidesulfovibrio brasiliensis]
MNGCGEEFVSLREVGRRLNIPASTVVYYKDKFSRYIPSVGGEGRRKRYPSEVLEVFRRIREMFGKNYSVEQIERELALKFGTMINDEQEGATSVSGDMKRVLTRLSEAMQDQTLFRSEIRSLRDEVAELRREHREVVGRYRERVGLLEKGFEMLKKKNAELERKISTSAGGGIDFPPAEYLASPLVIRTDGEFLGVQGKGRKHFSLKDFVSLIERRMSESMKVETSWSRKDGTWVLVVRTQANGNGTDQNIVLVTRKTVTPSGNTVTEIVRMNINGNDAPEALLLSLFRQVRSVFGG